MQYYLVNERFRAGAGLTYHLGPELDVDVPTGFGGRLTGTEEADDALGFMVAVDYVVNARVEVGARATQIDYEFADVGRRAQRRERRRLPDLPLRQWSDGHRDPQASDRSPSEALPEAGRRLRRATALP